MSIDGRDPTFCGESFGFDGMYICRPEHLPCDRVKVCPHGTPLTAEQLMEVAQRLLKEEPRPLAIIGEKELRKRE